MLIGFFYSILIRKIYVLIKKLIEHFGLIKKFIWDQIFIILWLSKSMSTLITLYSSFKSFVGRKLMLWIYCWINFKAIFIYSPSIVTNHVFSNFFCQMTGFHLRFDSIIICCKRFRYIYLIITFWDVSEIFHSFKYPISSIQCSSFICQWVHLWWSLRWCSNHCKLSYR